MQNNAAASFNLSQSINQLYDHMVKKYGFELEDAIRVAKIEYGYDDEEDDEEEYENRELNSEW